MNPELDKQLCEDFPKIFARRNESPKETALAFGFECGDGWYDIISTLCDVIQNQIKYTPDIPEVVALQVKEKYGTLRFYIYGGNAYTDGMIAMAESMSGKICELCGNKGKIIDDGWLKTRCNTCYPDEEIGEE